MKGYTLVELLVVIFIIGILTAIALPSFVSTSFRAKETQGRLFISQINRRQQTYFTEHGVFANNLEDLGIVNEKPTFYSFFFKSKTGYTKDVQVDATQNFSNPNMRDFRGCAYYVQSTDLSKAPDVVTTEFYEYFPSNSIPVTCP
jgi:prepilin-type N-terminal cleavage/methylation domain-containing protein